MEIPEGWTEWAGHGEIPFNEGTNHFRLYGDGFVWGPRPSDCDDHDADLWQWGVDVPSNLDIIAYKVVG